MGKRTQSPKHTAKQRTKPRTPKQGNNVRLLSLHGQCAGPAWIHTHTPTHTDIPTSTATTKKTNAQKERERQRENETQRGDCIAVYVEYTASTPTPSVSRSKGLYICPKHKSGLSENAVATVVPQKRSSTGGGWSSTRAAACSCH